VPPKKRKLANIAHRIYTAWWSKQYHEPIEKEVGDDGLPFPVRPPLGRTDRNV